MTNPTQAHGAMPELIEHMIRDYVPSTLQLQVRSAINDYARAAIQQAAGAVPEGWKLVPVEPTPEMIAAGHVGDALGCDVDAKDAKAVYGGAYSAMLAASPSPLGREAGKEGSSDHLVPCAGGGVTQWQPIETAPKDGERILVYGVYPDYPQGEPSIYTGSYGFAFPYFDLDPSPHEDEYNTVQLTECTHWMPLPPPPRPDAPTGQINPGSAPREDGNA